MTNNPLPQKSDHVLIKSFIVIFFNANPNCEFHGTSLNRFVYNRLNRYIYPDTIFRYMRELRQEGRIKYSVKSYADSIYRILPLH